MNEYMITAHYLLAFSQENIQNEIAFAFSQLRQ